MSKKSAWLLRLLPGIAFLSLGYFGYREMVLSYPKNWPKPIYRFEDNPLTPAGIHLGRMLFYDPILSRDSSVSCMSCHLQYTAFAHVDHTLSHGINDSIGFRNAPALQNLAWQSAFMWDGAAHYLDQQALGPITHPGEMGETLPHVLQKLQNHPHYPELFFQAFGSRIITGETLLKAIAQFELTLITSHSKYDLVMAGKKGMHFTEQEKNGLRLFRSYCASCHPEPLFTNGGYRKNGLKENSAFKDYGRYRVTGNPIDSFLFKVPSLRNIEFSFPYMHDGRFQKLSQVIRHYAGIGPGKSSVSEELAGGIILSDTERVDLEIFLLTLTDSAFLFNPEFSFPGARNLKSDNRR